MVEDLHRDVGLGRVRVRTVAAGLVQASVVAVVVVVHRTAPIGEAMVVTGSSAVHWTLTQCSLPRLTPARVMWAVLFRISRLGADP